MLHLIPIREKNVLCRKESESEWILFNISTNTVHSLKTIGFGIWDLCDGNHSIKDIIKHLKEKYVFDMEDERLEKGVIEFLQSLQQRNLVRW